MLRILFAFILLLSFRVSAQHYYLTADRVFDGEVIHEGWAVLVQGDKIISVGPKEKVSAPSGSIKINYSNAMILPGLIEGHSHLLLHPYNETPWDDQVMKESDGYRMARATVHAKNTLLAGFTTVRDLGSEGAGYADVDLKKAINDKIIPGPRMIVAGRAIVSTGSYGPKGFDRDMKIMLGAEEADGDNLIKVTRDQIGNGADVVKVYADYRWGKSNEPMPTFSIEEMKFVVETSKSSGRAVVAHASTAEGMRRAVLAGVETIEHGDDGTQEIFELMKEKNVALCPTLAATEALIQYRGWKKGSDPEPEKIKKRKENFKIALQSGVTILAGGDVGVFAHGENVRELELMNEYGMNTVDVLKSATSINAKIFHIDATVGSVKDGLKADLIIVSGDPSKNISDLRKIKFVMKDGVIFKNE
ncbi:MAG TPA: amidohydrolase [Cytophagales bacterium]|jgi:imidazolonepropionase-like amidohydrolase|nr:amidohydrolase [Cytophagales bacterium]